MELNIIDIYYIRRENSVIEYAKILIKNALDKKYMNVKVFDQIIKNYINESQIKTSYKVSKFLHDNNIVNLKLRKIINYTINYLDDDDVISDIYKNKDYIILISKMILFSLQINDETNIILNPKVRYTNVINNILEKSLKIYEEDFKEKILISQTELNEKIKENITDDRKLFKILSNNKLYIDFIKLTSDIYKVRFNYDIKALKKYMLNEINEQIKVEKLDYDFTIIASDMIAVLMLKLLLIENNKIIVILKLPEDFIDNIDLLNILIENLHSTRIKDRICLNIDYKSAFRNRPIVENLKTLGFKIGIYDMKKLNHTTYLFKDTTDYLFIDDELKNNSADIIEFCNNNNLTVFEEKLDSKDSIKEDYLLKH